MKADNSEVAWYVLVTKLHQETQAGALLRQTIDAGDIPNLFDVYIPQNRHVRVLRKGEVTFAPLLNCRVFVYGTQQAVCEFIQSTAVVCSLYIDRVKGTFMQVPEPQMRCFIDFNTFHVEELLVLEHPFANYVRVQPNGKLNMRARVIDGPFEGVEGVLVRVKKDHRLVFEMGDWAVSIPSVWDYHLVRVADSERDASLRPQRPARLADFLVGQLQAAGLPDEAPVALRHLLRLLHSDASLCRLAITLRREASSARQVVEENVSTDADTGHVDKKWDEFVRSVSPVECVSSDFPFSARAADVLPRFVDNLTSDEASALLTLAHSFGDDADALAELFPRTILRPFLTPTSGFGDIKPGQAHKVAHAFFDEYIVPLSIPQLEYSATSGNTEKVSTIYYAHVAFCEGGEYGGLLFADWSPLYSRYTRLEGSARCAQQKTLREYLPELGQIFSGCHPDGLRFAPVSPVPGQSPRMMLVQDFPCPDTEATESPAESSSASPAENPIPSEAVSASAIKFATTSSLLLQAIRRHTHLALWRGALPEVWVE